MTKVKFFWNNSQEALEADVNKFIEQLEIKHFAVNVVSISYSTSKTVSNYQIDHHCCLCYRCGNM